jgi:WD40 repeat protein
MARFFAVCLLGAGACVASVLLLSKAISDDTPPPPKPRETPKPRRVPQDPKQPAGSSDGKEAPPAPSADDELPVVVRTVVATGGGPRALVVQDGRVLPSERQDVPSEREGKLLFLATEVGPEEKVPQDKLITYEVSALAVEVSQAAWEKLPEKERVYNPVGPHFYYRRPLPTDAFEPGRTAIVRQTLRFRKLEMGDRVHKDQVLGWINPALALDEVGIKQANVEAAAADVLATVAAKVESKRRLDSIIGLRAKVIRAVTDDDYGIAQVTLEKYKQEEVSKRSAVRKAQRELSGAVTQLTMHQIRSSIDGVVKNLYKQNGEAVKNNDPVLQLQNPERLRVEAQLDLQDALPLRDRLAHARELRKKARALRIQARAARQKDDPAEAKQLEDEADRLVSVEVEASRVTPPLAVLAGHLQEVTCVAVSRDKDPRIVSGSEDRTVRVWKRGQGVDRWQEVKRLDHRAVVRAVACTGPKATSNRLLTATATGRARLFDLDHLDKGEVMLKDPHSGAINAVAFNPEGTRCVTGGEDRTIRLWDTSDGSLLGKVEGAHSAGVTSLAFTAKKQVVSAGRDKRLVVWNLAEGGVNGQTLERAESFDRRSGDVTQLGVDPTGERTLFDDGRELRVLSLATKNSEGVLQNASTTAAFSTMALFSPDGRTILTNGNAPGRLQLWRAPTDRTRPAELRQFAWSSGIATCGAFATDSSFAVTGTQDNRVLVWEMPARVEAEAARPGQLVYVEEFLDTSLKRVTVRAAFDNPGGQVIPGSNATIVIRPIVKLGAGVGAGGK